MRLLSWTTLAIVSLLSVGALGASARPAPGAGRAARQALPTVAVIGTGNVGSALGPQLAKLGHPVIYGSRDPAREAVRALVARTGPKGSAAMQQDAATRAEVIVLAVPADALEAVTKSLGPLTGKILVDVSTGAMRRGADGYMELVPGPSNSERGTHRGHRGQVPPQQLLPVLLERPQAVRRHRRFRRPGGVPADGHDASCVCVVGSMTSTRPSPP